jgi:TonB family protein
MSTASISPVRIPVSALSRFAPRIVIVLAVGLGHGGLAALFKLDPITVQRLQPDPGPITVELLASETLALVRDEGTLAVTDMVFELEPPRLPDDAIAKPQIESPRIDGDAHVYIAPYTARAQLAHGEVATVILLLQIAADGSVISAELVRSNGKEAANAAAMEYARATRWIPGLVDGEPRAMQASLTVILGEGV